MRTRRIHVTGASGSGTTTLGRALATALGVSHFDADDFYWQSTEPPFREARPKDERLRLVDAMFTPRAGWALSGSALGWGDLDKRFGLVVFLWTATDVRLARLMDREARRYGDAAIAPGGWRHRETQDFLAWAASYDTGSQAGRSLSSQRAALKALTCPALELDGGEPLDRLLSSVLAALN